MRHLSRLFSNRHEMEPLKILQGKLPVSKQTCTQTHSGQTHDSEVCHCYRQPSVKTFLTFSDYTPVLRYFHNKEILRWLRSYFSQQFIRRYSLPMLYSDRHT